MRVAGISNEQTHGDVKELRQFARVSLADGALAVQYVRNHAARSKDRDQIPLTKVAHFHEVAQRVEWRRVPQGVVDVAARNLAPF
jgi:hypothetical protein